MSDDVVVAAACIIGLIAAEAVRKRRMCWVRDSISVQLSEQLDSDSEVIIENQNQTKYSRL